MEGRPPAFLLLAGDGSQRRELEELAERCGLASRVKFLGWCDEVERVYGAFDLFTLTSRSEGTSVSLLEAMSSGLCPVVTDVGGNRAVLGPELSALLVPPEDEVSLAETWKRYLVDPELRGVMGRRARERVERAFSLDQMVEQHLSLYRSLLDATLGSLAGAT